MYTQHTWESVVMLFIWCSNKIMKSMWIKQKNTKVKPRRTMYIIFPLLLADLLIRSVCEDESMKGRTVDA